jgi:hypothetical protein
MWGSPLKLDPVMPRAAMPGRLQNKRPRAIYDAPDLPARRIGVDASTRQVNASLRRPVRRDTGEDHQERHSRYGT